MQPTSRRCDAHRIRFSGAFICLALLVLQQSSQRTVWPCGLPSSPSLEDGRNTNSSPHCGHISLSVASGLIDFLARIMSQSMQCSVVRVSCESISFAAGNGSRRTRNFRCRGALIRRRRARDAKGKMGLFGKRHKISTAKDRTH